MNPTIEALLSAAGYPTPPTAEDAVRMLLSEIEGARAVIDEADDRIGVLEQDLDTQTAAAFANQRVANDCYRDGYRVGHQHGYFAGRQAAACAPCTCPEGSPS